ncbi:MAG: fumarylacetoacetate hydrolase family protein [Alphaproteobacteria bacterium]|jgi:2-keto-4-pentenoate hydratase/2-oxohepta-3-ene-1,7-dioic acid hydratase in catechol pathway|nr:fumarylacetoacetate hydrolase family protein [Alphaproteobacteria bacterium]MDP6564258.1 fumarylacetoacetate hydrolase family protein [Alphaproteobacteria bacterium]MDP6815219.1 fumarylacetoacetate hydrolase family protein [Alphaproteobacteria bacterium]
MRIATIDHAGRPTLVVRRGDQFVDLSVAAPDLPRDLLSLLRAGALERAGQAAEAAGDDALVEAAGASYLPPIGDPEKIICLGLNYRDHAIETGNPIPDYPVIFTRMTTTLAAHGKPMILPKAASDFDYEAELAVVIGTGGRHIAMDAALDHVAGYSCFNDGSIRSFQFKSNQFTMGKNFDGSGGFGPELVTPDELPAGGAGLRIQCRLNGETMQDSSTDQHIFDVPSAISIISEVMSFRPGDVIIMGTPPGVGAARDPQVWMKDGDVCEVEIEGIGVLSNPIKAE